MMDDSVDPILCNLRRTQLFNKPEDRVKVLSTKPKSNHVTVNTKTKHVRSSPELFSAESWATLSMKCP